MGLGPGMSGWGLIPWSCLLGRESCLRFWAGWLISGIAIFYTETTTTTTTIVVIVIN